MSKRSMPSLMSARLLTGRSVLLPPYPESGMEEMAKTYGLRRDQILRHTEKIKEWEREYQGMLNTLSREDGINPPRLEISQNAAVWTNGGMHGGFYRPGKVGLIAMEPSVFVTGHQGDRWPGTSCASHIFILLHEYRHHWQYQTMGIAKVNQIYDTEGSVDWEGHKLEREADAYAKKHCSEWWKWSK